MENKNCKKKFECIYHCRIGIEITSVRPECKIIQEECGQRAVLRSDSSKECTSIGGAVGK